ncbi:MAG: fumarylacetoacetate hydrolase family protein [Rhodospirillales bacterium]|nr:fumarylacetoacetate hydrolase family protein [Rhodospirillales bacterium]
MKLVTYRKADGVQSVGAIKDEGIVDLTSALSVGSVKQLLEQDLLEQAKVATESESPQVALADVILDIPVPDPQKIFCIGVNYMNRNAEYKDGSAAPEYPSIFVRNPLSFTGHGQSLIRPPESNQLDYEGEIVLVIGKPGRRISRSDAMQHVAGLTIMNEGSIRDWLRHGKFNVTQGKNWDRSGAIGPAIQTDLSAIDPTDMHIETWVNDELRQSDTTASMAFPFNKLIEYVSTFCTLCPGDMIATGTPTGAGARFDPPKWLVPGDTVRVVVDGVGTLENGIADET